MKVECYYCKNNVESLIYIENMAHISDYKYEEKDSRVWGYKDVHTTTTYSNPETYIFGVCKHCLSEVKLKIEEKINKHIKSTKKIRKNINYISPLIMTLGILSIIDSIFLHIVFEQIGWGLFAGGFFLFLSIMIFVPGLNEIDNFKYALNFYKKIDNSDLFVFSIHVMERLHEGIMKKKGRCLENGIVELDALDDLINKEILYPINVKIIENDGLYYGSSSLDDLNFQYLCSHQSGWDSLLNTDPPKKWYSGIQPLRKEYIAIFKSLAKINS